jgi:serine/threonine protein kinase
VADDRYTVQQQLGSGNFGAVFLATHAVLNRECALKLIPAHGDDVLDEARHLAVLPDHDNVVKVLDAGEWDDDRVFIASELCMGGSLADLADGHPLDPGAACEVISDTCRGLEHLHEHGLLHLDIRPANILLADGKPRLADFGLARWKHDADVDTWYGPHAAPELVETSHATPASDIYSMAMTLAHVLTGGALCRPFPVLADLVSASADGDWPPLDKLGPNVPPRLRKVIDAGTQYDPDARPGSVADFKRLLDKATPVVSLAMTGEGVLESTDGTWTVTNIQKRNGRHTVEVRKNDRRRTALCEKDLTAIQAAKFVQRTVKQLAESPP